MGLDGSIGYRNALPWKMGSDLAHFKKATMGGSIVMGRKCFESIGRPLPGRQNIVLTRSAGMRFPGCETASSLESALVLAHGPVFIVGGAEIYKLAAGHVDQWLVTEVQAMPLADRFFPEGVLGGLASETVSYISAGSKDQYDAVIKRFWK